MNDPNIKYRVNQRVAKQCTFDAARYRIYEVCMELPQKSFPWLSSTNPDLDNKQLKGKTKKIYYVGRTAQSISTRMKWHTKDNSRIMSRLLQRATKVTVHILSSTSDYEEAKDLERLFIYSRGYRSLCANIQHNPWYKVW